MVDVPADTTTTSTISVGGIVTGILDAPGDHDWYAITLTAGQSITITLNGSGASAVPDTYLNLRDSFGNIIAHNDDSGGTLNSKIVFTATSSGTYYIDAGAWDTQSQPVPASTDQYTGGYTLSVQPYTPPPVWNYDQIANQLVNGFWNVQNGETSRHFAVSPGGTITVNLTELTPAEQNLARSALAEWSDIIGVTFREVTAGGQILFHNQEDPADPGPRADTINHTSGGIISSSEVSISTSWVTQYGTGLNTYSFQTYLHEIGHALGLGHAGDYNGTADYAADALYANDSWSTSIMSYFDDTENSYFANQNFSRVYALTPMDGDIVAMQQLYGLSTTTRAGDTTYGFNSTAGRAVFDANQMTKVGYAIFDSGGIDTLDYSNTFATQSINLNPETFSSVLGYIGNVSIARGTVIENAIGGSGNDTIIGNDVANRLIGGPGNDTLFGGAGDDFLDGGTGVDQMTGGAGSDMFSGTIASLNGDSIMDFGAGDRIVFTDASLSSFTFSLAGNTLTYSGGSLAIALSTSGTLSASAFGTGVQLSFASEFGSPSLKLAAFGASSSVGGWSSSDAYPREIADVNGDGRMDIVGFGKDGVYVALGQADGSFAGLKAATTAFGNSVVAGGWSSDNQFPRELADVNGDGRADIVGFGKDGVYVALGQTDGTFSAPKAVTSAFGSVDYAGGWSSNDKFPRELADVNGDGKIDIVGFGNDGVYVALGNGDGTFATPKAATNAFGFATFAGGWSSQTATPRLLADVNGDGRADIVGFGNSGVYVAFGQADGTFSAPNLALREFGSSAASGGWSSNQVFPRELADVNGDHKIDIVGFSNNGVYIALGNGDGTFHTSIVDVAAYGASSAAGGWSSQDSYPRILADLNHDGAADIVGFGASGMYVSYSSGNIFG